MSAFAIGSSAAALAAAAAAAARWPRPAARLGGAVVVARLPGQHRRAAAEREERKHRNARQHRQHEHHAGRHAERLRIAGELPHQRLVGGAADAGLGDQQARRGGDDQRRHLGDEAVADGQHGVGAGGLAERQALLGDTDDDAADDVDEDDQKARDGVAADEFRGAVHGAEEAAFVLERLAARLGVFSSIRPADRSASIAICLPGIASR